MKVAWIPRYRVQEAASSRIRVYYLHKTLLERSIESVLEFNPTADVLVIQKAASKSILEAISDFKGKIIFDYDDVDVCQLKYFNDVVSRADLITVDTPLRRTAVQALRLNKPVAVLPDCIDYDLEPLPLSRADSLCWFGYGPNMASVYGMLEGAVEEGYDVRVITDCSAARPVEVECTCWNFETFIEDLRRSGIALLSHEGGDDAKSNNKMLVAVTAGLPVIAGPSSSYEEILLEYDLDYAYCESEDAFADALRRLSDLGERRDYLRAIQSDLFRRFNRRAVCDQFLALLD